MSDDDFCLLHGYQYMESKVGEAVSRCKVCEEAIEAREAARSAAEQEIAALKRERDDYRRRLFNTRQVEGHSHSTACSIWGDNGRGGTAENYPEPLPCNCGCLINFHRDKAETAERSLAEALQERTTAYEQNARLRSELRETQEKLAEALRQNSQLRDKKDAAVKLANIAKGALDSAEREVNELEAALNEADDLLDFYMGQAGLSDKRQHAAIASHNARRS